MAYVRQACLEQSVNYKETYLKIKFFILQCFYTFLRSQTATHPSIQNVLHTAMLNLIEYANKCAEKNQVSNIDLFIQCYRLTQAVTQYLESLQTRTLFVGLMPPDGPLPDAPVHTIQSILAQYLHLFSDDTANYWNAYEAPCHPITQEFSRLLRNLYHDYDSTDQWLPQEVYQVLESFVQTSALTPERHALSLRAYLLAPLQISTPSAIYERYLDYLSLLRKIPEGICLQIKEESRLLELLLEHYPRDVHLRGRSRIMRLSPKEKGLALVRDLPTPV